jgi:hypothetical protein
MGRLGAAALMLMSIPNAFVFGPIAIVPGVVGAIFLLLIMR